MVICLRLGTWPGVEDLDQTMRAAVALEVGRVGLTALGVGDRVVHIAVGGGVVAAGPATRQVAAAHEIRQRLDGM
jgi:hypothetical protein